MEKKKETIFLMNEKLLEKLNAIKIVLKKREELVKPDQGDAVDPLDTVFRANLYGRVANLPAGADNVNWTLNKRQ